MDECHYATKKHGYAAILGDPVDVDRGGFYHGLPCEERPRVLGLTASPLINVPVNADDARLRRLLSDFERRMDARLCSCPPDVLPEPGGRATGAAEEAVVAYDSRRDAVEASFPPATYDSRRGDALHWSREKEIKQLKQLCDELGLHVTALYAETLAKEIGRNEFDGASIK